MHGLLLAVAAFTAQAQAPIHYKMESSTVQDIDMSGMGMAIQHIAMKSTALVTVTMSDTVGGRLAHVVVDSVVFDGGEMMALAASQMPPEATANGKGTFFHIFLPTGQPQQPSTPSTPSMSVAILVPAIAALFPAMKPGMKAGDTWADTVKKDSTVNSPAGSVTATVHAVTVWKVGAKTGNDFVIDANVSTSITATLPGGMAGTMEMTATGIQHLVGPIGGPLKQGTVNGTTDGKVTMMGSAVPVRGTTTITIIALP